MCFQSIFLSTFVNLKPAENYEKSILFERKEILASHLWGGGYRLVDLTKGGYVDIMGMRRNWWYVAGNGVKRTVSVLKVMFCFFCFLVSVDELGGPEHCGVRTDQRW